MLVVSGNDALDVASGLVFLMRNMFGVGAIKLCLSGELGLGEGPSALIGSQLLSVMFLKFLWLSFSWSVIVFGICGLHTCLRKGFVEMCASTIRTRKCIIAECRSPGFHTNILSFPKAYLRTPNTARLFVASGDLNLSFLLHRYALNIGYNITNKVSLRPMLPE